MMMRFFVLGGALFVAQGAMAQDFPACDRFPVGEADYACNCAPNALGGSVWGTEIYTADSNICTAAIHAGVIDAELGGDVLAIAQPGQTAYVASESFGIASREWGGYDASFSFNPKGPRIGSVARVEACGRFDVSLGRMQCSCDGDSSFGAVWGSGPYTADSDVCAAAIHAGAISPAGGVVTVLGIGGLEQYLGSTRNGIATQDWGAYGDSIIFDANEGG